MSNVEQARQWLAEADYILIGAGAGLSAAAGLLYSGEDFEREFSEWISRYGITDLYSSSFYPFATEEERWAYWARHIWFARYRPAGLPLYRQLLQLVERCLPADRVGEERYFVLTTNVDAQFEKAGFPRDRIFATQGDYAYFQAADGKNKSLVYNEAWVREALAATDCCRIPTELIPRHPETGEPLTTNLRCDDTFVEDDRWHHQAQRCQDFVSWAQAGRLVLLEFGVGFNTPAIIRFPFERLAAQCRNVSLIRFNRDYPQPMLPELTRFVPFTENVSDVLRQL